MLSAEDLILFSDMLAEARIAPAVAGSDPMPPLAIGLRINGGSWSLFPAANLSETKYRDRAKIAAMVERALAQPGVAAVAVVHEAWMSRAPGADDAEFSARTAHLAFAGDGRAEAVMCALHTRDTQTAILHGIARTGKRRALIKGPALFEGLSLGGQMARAMPTRH